MSTRAEVQIRGRLQPALEALVIGASAGGVDAVLRLLERLPGDYRLPIVCVLHLRDGHDSLLVELFQRRLALPVREVVDKEYLRGGTLYFAPPGYHLSIESDRSFSLSREEPRHFARPSIDILFESAADVFGPHLAGILLTGASADGALGLQQIQRSGGLALVQEPADAQVPVMPQAALALLTPDFLLPLTGLRDLLAELETPSC